MLEEAQYLSLYNNIIVMLILHIMPEGGSIWDLYHGCYL